MSTTTDQTYEAAVIRAACEMAETHVLDVLCALEKRLHHLRFNARPWHDGKVGDAEARAQAKELRRRVLRMLPMVVNVDCHSLVNQSDEDGLLRDYSHSAVAQVHKHLTVFIASLGAAK